MIRTIDLSFGYTGQEAAVVTRANLQFAAGEFALICGPTGSGKSTLLKLLNGLAPHFTGGNSSGQIFIDEIETTKFAPHQLAELVGYVNQQPEGSFVADTVIDELVFGLEQIGIEPSAMHSRIEKLSLRLGLADLLKRPLAELSGGQQQRVAIASALAAGQRVLLLDEPTSALDPIAAHEILLLLKSISKEDQITVLLAEHRIERVIELVDSVVVVHGDASVTKNVPRLAFNNYRTVPPTLEIAQKLKWAEMPISISEAAPLWLENRPKICVEELERPKLDEVAISATNITVSYGDIRAVDNVSVEIREGEIVALMGENGSGKTSLLWAIHGPKARLDEMTLVPQQAADLLFLNSLAEELEESDRFAEVQSNSTANLFERFAGRIDPSKHPRDLSSGQQLALVLAMQLVKGAKVLLLDEPTRGFDYEAKRNLAMTLRQLRDDGRVVLLATHDIEFVAQVADRVLLMSEGKLIANQSIAEAVGFESKFASQLALISQEPGVVTIGQIHE